MTLESIFNLLLEMKSNHVCIYGVGKNGLHAIDYCNELGIEIEAICDRKQGITVKGWQTISLEEFEKLNPHIVCLVTPATDVDTERQRLEKHFDTVVGMEIFGKIERLKQYSPCSKKGWGYESYAPFNRYDSPYINEENMEYAYFQRKHTKPKDVNLNEEGQVAFGKELNLFYNDFYQDIEMGDFKRWHQNNGMFDESDAALYYSILRFFKPKKIIEIGSGHSTALALDVKEKYLSNLEMTCIEPYPERLLENVQSNEIKLYKKYVQEIDSVFFERLETGDILFIDSSHVAKMGGDIPYEYFEILPQIKSGVVIHIHDIFYPFDYPERWIREGRCYNEAFILRALLMNSESYEILFFNDMMYQTNTEMYLKMCKNPGGSSIWLRKK